MVIASIIQLEAENFWLQISIVTEKIGPVVLPKPILNVTAGRPVACLQVFTEPLPLGEIQQR
jgi:hypothetical protein